jgi:pyruvate/2-oxoglutarate dehydrogenase complex dihydrolipoamide dehydrogenase (E3) component
LLEKSQVIFNDRNRFILEVERRMTQFETQPVSISPMDEFNQTLVENLHPSNWKNPQPASCYNLVVIGGGTAGLVTAAGAGLLGGKVALIEKYLLGGDCTNVGCVPSKSLIRSGRIAATVSQASDYGIRVPEGVEVDFSAVMERMRKVRSEISSNDSAKRFTEEFGVDVFFGEAHFFSQNTIDVAGQKLRFKKAVIATGSHPTIPEIDGLEEAGYLTNETVFYLTERPERLAIIGGGYIGCELAQTFQRLGSKVVLLQRSSKLLKHSQPEVSDLIQEVFAQEKINVVLNAEIKQISTQPGEKTLFYEVSGIEQKSTVDQIIVATGRQPNIKGLNLEAVGVKSDPKTGIIINDYLQTTNPNIYAVGDVCMQSKFTHAADAAARIVIQNALFSVLGIGRKKLSNLIIPSCVYTDPEVAHVGITEAEILAKPERVKTFYIALSDVDRACIDGQTNGFAKVHVRHGSDKILGATIVAAHAGEMINQITLAMVGNLGLGTLGNTIYPYPTQAEVIRKAADQYRFTWLKEWVRKLTTIWLSLQR